MDRRRFLQIAGIAGLGVVAPIGLREGSAGSNKYQGPFWIMINAGGGWDPTMTVDPKGGTPMDRNSVNMSYTKGEIVPIGQFNAAPTVYNAQAGMGTVKVISVPDFITKHGSRISVVNGIDTTTNNHDVGTRTTWSGSTQEGAPAFAALVAGLAVESIPVPLAFLSTGGYDSTGGVVPLTRVGNLGAVQKLAYPNVLDPNNAMSDLYHTPTTASRIAAAQSARIQSLRDRQTLHTLRTSMNSLYLARQGDDGLAALGEQLRTTQLVKIDDIPDLAPITNRGQVDDLERLMQGAQVAALAFKAGVAVSANIGIGGFDTHSGNDAGQTAQALQILRALDYIFGMLDQMGLSDKTYVVVGSDFGRTPYYNDQDGKDHWNITSMLFAGPKIPGGRAVGYTDDAFKPLTVNKSSLQPDAGGIRIETGHVHLALRKIAGITGTAIDKAFPIAGDALPIFG